MKESQTHLFSVAGGICFLSAAVAAALLLGCYSTGPAGRMNSSQSAGAAYSPSVDVDSWTGEAESASNLKYAGVPSSTQSGNDQKIVPEKQFNGSGTQVVSLADSPERLYREQAAASLSRTMQRLQAAPTDELWIIAENPEPTELDSGAGADSLKEMQSKGSLLAVDPLYPEEVEKMIPMPLKKTTVEATILDIYASVNVRQSYHNPYDTKIEAIYVFPLPSNAAVNEFLMVVDDRTIRGIIRKREEAEEIYHEARRQGFVTSMMTQERPNIFTQKVANIEPGKAIDVDIHYYHTLRNRDGNKEFIFPMVVGPRFNPSDTKDGIGARAHDKPAGSSGQPTEVPYLKPGETNEVGLDFSLTLLPSVPWAKVESLNHRILHSENSSGSVVLSLENQDGLMDRDFVLRLKPAAEKTASGLVVSQVGQSHFAALSIYPTESVMTNEEVPLEMVFVLDCSGSMSGKPLDQAKSAIEKALRKLTPRDTFQLIQFSNNASQLGDAPLVADEENIDLGLKYLRRMNGSGGTMMLEGVRAALNFPHDEDRLRFVCFMTDGYIGNEADILREVYRNIGSSRIFSFGVGSSTNRFLMNQLAYAGRGASAFLSYNDDAEVVMEQFMARIRRPALTDVQIDWGAQSTQASSFPEVIPDVFTGRPVHLIAKIDGPTPSKIIITGKHGNDPYREEIPWPDSVAKGAHLRPLWAREKIGSLSQSMLSARTWDAINQMEADIESTALEYGLLSSYTAFIAVDSTRVTGGSQGVQVPVAVPVPDGVRYETTVGPGVDSGSE